MNQEFVMAVKSTVDKLGYDMATSLSAVAIDMDDMTTADIKLAQADPSVIWQLMTIDEVPCDPLYEVVFVIGAKTTKDPASYTLIQFSATLNQTVYKTAELPIHDYSGATAGPLEGKLFVSAIELAPQRFDEQSGIRLFSVGCKAMRI